MEASGVETTGGSGTTGVAVAVLVSVQVVTVTVMVVRSENNRQLARSEINRGYEVLTTSHEVVDAFVGYS